MDIKIRDIKIEDVHVTFKHLKELANIIGLTDRLVTTADSLNKELFGPNADWYGLTAEVSNHIAGTCLYTFTNINREFHPTPAIYIDVLYVAKEFRKLGIAKALITSVATIAKQKNLERIELWCSKSNDIAQVAYASIGATKIDTIDVMRFDVEKLL